jgi:hypothetical protein
VSAPAPTAPLQQLLREIPQRFPTERIDRVWIFAPREMTGKESGLVVLSLTAAQASTETVPEVRHVVTWHYEAVRARGGFAGPMRSPSRAAPRRTASPA